MASKKQRRRQQKLKRHEYEEVYVDEEGNVLPPEEAEELVATTTGKPVRQSSAKGRAGTRERVARTIEPPSFRKSAKRGLLFLPLMLLLVFVLPAREGATDLGKVLNALVLTAFMLPFFYFTDSITWRMHQRRLTKEAEAKNR